MSASTPALAQAVDAAASATDGLARPASPATAAVASVPVVGQRPSDRIDRQVYDVGASPGSSNGSAADALANVPSVAVDPDGTVRLRGNGNVQILIDGKPSAMLEGDARGAMLNAMAAGDIASIEVINNPGAQFGNEGGGGPILNLVTKRERQAGSAGGVNANAGTAGRYNGAVFGSHNDGGWGYQGRVSVRHDGRNAVSDVDRDRLDPAGATSAHSSQRGSAAGLNDSLAFNVGAHYNLDGGDTLTVNADHVDWHNDQHGLVRYVDADGSGTTIDDYLRSTTGTIAFHSYSWGGTYDHKGTLPGEKLKLALRVSASNHTDLSDYANGYAIASGASADAGAHQRNAGGTRLVDFSGDYERPLATGTAMLGYKVVDSQTRADTLYADFDGLTAALLPDPARSNSYAVAQKTMALYGTYQMRLNERWGVMAGLRAEYTQLAFDAAAAAAGADKHYVNYLPSAFATYQVGADTNLRFSYAHRLRRPSAGDLNPYRTYVDDNNVSSGNPTLRPGHSDSVEIGLETTLGGLATNLRGYYRRDADAIVPYRYFISDSVLLSTRANGAGSQAGGLELTASGKLTPSITLNASANLAHNRQTLQDDSGAYVTRAVNALSGQVRLRYQPSTVDEVALAVQMQGKSLSGLGYREPDHTVNLSLRHGWTARLDLVLNATDVFSSNKAQTVTNSGTLRETSLSRADGRLIYVGLAYRFGGPDGAGGRR